MYVFHDGVERYPHHLLSFLSPLLCLKNLVYDYEHLMILVMNQLCVVITECMLWS